MHSDCLKLVTWLSTSNHQALFQSKVITLPTMIFYIRLPRDDLDYILANEKEIDNWNQKNQSNQFIN